MSTSRARISRPGRAPVRRKPSSARKSPQPGTRMPQWDDRLGGVQTVQRLVQRNSGGAPSWSTPRTFTKVTTKRLNPKGVFTSQVLLQISTAWTKAAAFRKATTAQKIVDALELSTSFVEIANKLDKYYAKRRTPGIDVTFGHTGTKFIPAGTSYQWHEDEPVTEDPDYDQIYIDFSKPYIGGAPAEQIAQFVKGIVHEANHAYNYRIAKSKSRGLKGHVREERRTRKAEIKTLEQIRAATTDRDLKKELTEQIAETRRAGLSEKGVAKSMPSSGGATYLESYFLSGAISRFRAGVERWRKKVARRGWTGLEGVADIRKLSDFNMMIYSMNATLMIHHNQPPIRRSRAAMLLRLLGAKKNLKQLTRQSFSKLNAAEKLMMNQILLLKAYQIKKAVKDEWERFDKKGGDRDAHLRHIAKQYLGRPHAYRGLSNKN